MAVSTVANFPVETLDFKLYGKHDLGGSWGYAELQGRLHVLTTNYRDHSHIDVYDLELTKLHQYELPPARANSISATATEVFVAILKTEMEPAMVRVYTAEGGFVREWSSGLTHPMCLEAKGDEIYVGDAAPNAVKVFDTFGNLRRQWDHRTEITDMAIDNGKLYMTHWHANCVTVHDVQTGAEVNRWGSKSPWALYHKPDRHGSEPMPAGGTFWEPCGVVVVRGFVFSTIPWLLATVGLSKSRLAAHRCMASFSRSSTAGSVCKHSRAMVASCAPSTQERVISRASLSTRASESSSTIGPQHSTSAGNCREQIATQGE
jgi:hypothetical protein